MGHGAKYMILWWSLWSGGSREIYENESKMKKLNKTQGELQKDIKTYKVPSCTYTGDHGSFLYSSHTHIIPISISRDYLCSQYQPIHPLTTHATHPIDPFLPAGADDTAAGAPGDESNPSCQPTTRELKARIPGRMSGAVRGSTLSGDQRWLECDTLVLQVVRSPDKLQAHLEEMQASRAYRTPFSMGARATSAYNR